MTDDETTDRWPGLKGKPLFEFCAPDGHRWEVYENGYISGFPDGTIVINRASIFLNALGRVYAKGWQAAREAAENDEPTLPSRMHNLAKYLSSTGLGTLDALDLLAATCGALIYGSCKQGIIDEAQAEEVLERVCEQIRDNVESGGPRVH